jgi:CubicO group peptidase (beta-lactamase class C family)
MLKIGYLYLHDGMWDGQQIIPASWVAYAEAGKVPAILGLHYANLWWSMPEKGALLASGRHSQWLLVLPKYDIVAAMTGYLPDDELYPMGRFIDTIVAAVRPATTALGRRARVGLTHPSVPAITRCLSETNPRKG